ncbi:MAG: hypothetical protein DRI65_18075 [Chloroflexota bacterium]|nr:MAG: hypothetical protein DRI65_18075 [Chloroflexota bacterium]
MLDSAGNIVPSDINYSDLLFRENDLIGGAGTVQTLPTDTITKSIVSETGVAAGFLRTISFALKIPSDNTPYPLPITTSFLAMVRAFSPDPTMVASFMGGSAGPKSFVVNKGSAAIVTTVAAAPSAGEVAYGITTDGLTVTNNTGAELSVTLEVAYTDPTDITAVPIKPDFGPLLLHFFEDTLPELLFVSSMQFVYVNTILYTIPTVPNTPILDKGTTDGFKTFADIWVGDAITVDGTPMVVNSAVPAYGTDILDLYQDGSGRAAYLLDGDVTDLSGNHNGTAQAITYGAGVYDQAAIFNGTNGGSKFTATMAFVDNEAFTVSMWINLQAQQGNNFQNGIFEVGSYTANTGFGLWAVDDASGTLKLRFNQVNGNIVTISLDTWTHLALSFSGTECSVYVDKVLIRTLARTYTAASNLTVGGRNDNNTEFARMELDQLRFIDRASNVADIEKLYTEGPMALVDTTAVTAGGTPTAANLNQYEAKSAPVSQEILQDYTGCTTIEGTFSFANTSAGSAANSLRAVHPIKDGDALTILLDDGVTYTDLVASGVTHDATSYNYQLTDTLLDDDGLNTLTGSTGGYTNTDTGRGVILNSGSTKLALAIPYTDGIMDISTRLKVTSIGTTSPTNLGTIFSTYGAGERGYTLYAYHDGTETRFSASNREGLDVVGTQKQTPAAHFTLNQYHVFRLRVDLNAKTIQFFCDDQLVYDYYYTSAFNYNTHVQIGNEYGHGSYDLAAVVDNISMRNGRYLMDTTAVTGGETPSRTFVSGVSPAFRIVQDNVATKNGDTYSTDKGRLDTVRTFADVVDGAVAQSLTTKVAFTGSEARLLEFKAQTTV